MVTSLHYCLTLLAAVLLAVGPSYCRAQCQTSEAAATTQPLSCCQGDAGGKTPEPVQDSSHDCVCKVHPQAMDVRGDQLAVQSLVIGTLPLAALEIEPWVLTSDSPFVASDIPPPVSLHVLKCVWRC